MIEDEIDNLTEQDRTEVIKNGWNAQSYIGTAKSEDNPLQLMFQNGNVIRHEEVHARDKIRGIKGPPIMEFPMSYPIVDENGNFLCMSDDYIAGGITRENVKDALAVLSGQQADEPIIVEKTPPIDDAQEYRYGYGDD